jgi:hypothetical protein
MSGNVLFSMRARAQGTTFLLQMSCSPRLKWIALGKLFQVATRLGFYAKKATCNLKTSERCECKISVLELNRYAVETAFHFFSLSYVSSRRLTIALESN